MSTSESRKPVDPGAPSQRFLFETSFDADTVAAQEAAAEPSFSAAELEAARQAAYAEGEAAGRQDAVNGIEKQLLNGLGRLVQQMATLSASQGRYQDGLTERSVRLALKAIRKMFPALAERNGLVEIEAVLVDCLQEARTEPRIVVRIAGTLVDLLQQRVDALTAASGHQGTVKILADDTLGPADCRVEWAEGGAERVVETMWQEFEAATQRIFQSADDESIDEPNGAGPVAKPVVDMAHADFDPATAEPPVTVDGLAAEADRDAPEAAVESTAAAETLHDADPGPDLEGRVNGHSVGPPQDPPTGAVDGPAEPESTSGPAAAPEINPPHDPPNAS